MKFLKISLQESNKYSYVQILFRIEYRHYE